MKKLTLIFILFLWSGLSIAQRGEPLDKALDTKEALIAASASFEAGNADTPMRYYSGILAGLVHIDEHLSLFLVLDEEDASVYRFRETIAECLSIITQTRNSLDQYKFRDWALQKSMRSKTLDWLKSVEGLMEKYMNKLAEPLSRADDTWSDDEFEFYEKYQAAYAKFLEIDDDWVSFQYRFAEANNFEVEGEIVVGELGEVIPVDSVLTDEEIAIEFKKYQDELANFSKGSTSNGFDYFQGILAGIILIDIDLKRFEQMDDLDATAQEIILNGDSCLMKVEKLKESMAFYNSKDWPLRSEMNDITLRWLNSAETLVNDYYYKMADALSRPDETWSTEEMAFYEDFLVALEKYYEIDLEWVDFQYVYAEANDFEIGWVIDENALLREPGENED